MGDSVTAALLTPNAYPACSCDSAPRLSAIVYGRTTPGLTSIPEILLNCTSLYATWNWVAPAPIRTP